MNKEKWKQVPGDSLPASRFCRLIHSPVKRYLDIMMKILGITAHPDDEVGAFGGSLLLYHSRGVETHVICLTAGEAASNRGEARSREELAAIRREQARQLSHPRGSKEPFGRAMSPFQPS